jgi:hypothetical protein
MTLPHPRTAPPGDEPDALVHANRPSEVSPQDIEIVTPPEEPEHRLRPTAESLVQRLRIMQVQDWSREEHHR